MRIRSITPAVLASLDSASVGLLMQTTQDALAERCDLDLQMSREGLDFVLTVHVLYRDEVRASHEWKLPYFNNMPGHVQVAILSVWAATLRDQARRSRSRALLGIREIDRRERMKGG